MAAQAPNQTGLYLAPRRPWYNRQYRREKRLELINKTKLSIIRAALYASRLVGAALGMPIDSIVNHTYTPDYNVDVVTINMPNGNPLVVLSYQSTRKVITPRDMKIIWRRLQSARNRFVPPNADALYVLIVPRDTRITIGAWLFAKAHHIIIHREDSDTLYKVLRKYIAKRLEGFARHNRRDRMVSAAKAATFGVLATIYNFLIGRVIDKLELLLIGDRIRSGVTIDELWRMLLPTPGPPLPT